MSIAAAKNRNSPASDRDEQGLKELYESIRRGKAKLVGLNGEARPLPDSLHSFLAELAGLLNEGKSAYIIQDQAKFTTVEAAAMLGVSRQFLINLLESNEIPYHMVGTHRRVYAQDLVQYKAKRDERRKKVLGELARAEADEGLYGRSSTADED